MFFGYFFMILGIFILLQAMGIIVGNFWGYFWGIALIALGFAMLGGKKNCHCWLGVCNKKDHQHKDQGQI